jgi:hypothetical protein
MSEFNYAYSQHVLTDSISTTSVINYMDGRGGILKIPAGYGGGTADVYVCEVEDGAYAQLRDQFGNNVVIDMSAGAVTLPHAELFAAGFIKLVLATDDSDPVILMQKV